MKVSGMQQEMQMMAAEARNSSSPANAQQVAAEFSDILGQAVNNVNGLQKSAGELATRFDEGDRSVSLADVMIARNKSSVAFDATVQVRNKLVEAYKELMNMPV
ncbi:flagellar hook-basal body complex protein FliE [Parasalinivibrio latis]|uniref:flagellar hook-basal body complex protein FliE n=1 Tax=Parasalinivibrio latis TaxID=2952610 RepID=UPI0030E5806E